MNSVFSNFDDLDKSQGALRDLTESPMQKNLRPFEIFLEITNEEFIANVWKTSTGIRIQNHNTKRACIECLSFLSFFESGVFFENR